MLDVYLAQGTTTDDDTLFELLLDHAMHAKYGPSPQLATDLHEVEGRVTVSRPSLGKALFRLRMACLVRCSFSISANRTWPSPPGPKPTPGDVATLASCTRNDENSIEPISRYGSGIGAQTNIVPLRWLDVPTDAIETVAQRVTATLVDLLHDLRIVRRLVQCDGCGDLNRLERAVVEIALELRQRLHHVGVTDQKGLTRQPAIENDLVIEYNSTATSFAPSACMIDGGW